MSKKNNAKSIRLSDKVMNYILSYRGNGFNEKFENIILDAMESEKERERQIEFYENQIETIKEKYFLMADKLRHLEPMVQAALHVNSRINQLNKEFDECITNISAGPGKLQEK